MLITFGTSTLAGRILGEALTTVLPQRRHIALFRMLYVYIPIHANIIYLFGEKERERERERDTDRERERERVCEREKRKTQRERESPKIRHGNRSTAHVSAMSYTRGLLVPKPSTGWGFEVEGCRLLCQQRGNGAVLTI